MSNLSEIELNREDHKLDWLKLDPRIPKGTPYFIFAGSFFTIGLWILHFSGKTPPPFDIWFFGGAILCTLLNAGLTLLHWHGLKNNYAVAWKNTKSGFRKALAKKGRWRDTEK